MSNASTPINVVTGMPVDGLVTLTTPPAVVGSQVGDILVGSGGGRLGLMPAGTDGHVLFVDSTQPHGVVWMPIVPDPPSGPAGGDLLGTFPNPSVFPANVSRAGIVQLAGDLSGTSVAPTVTQTHLSAPLPVAQGGTASAVQNFVDLTTAQTVAGVKNFTSNITVPTPVGASDVAPKSYVDSLSSGLSTKPSVVTATTAALPANTYSNGASGVGATLTGTATGILTIDGHVIALNDRVLVKNEVAAANNGIYLCTTAGAVGVAYVLTRAVDMDQAAEIPAAFVFVTDGTVTTNTGWVVTGTGPYTVGTTAIVWSQFSGAGTITAGTGLSLAGTVMSLQTPVASGNLPDSTGAAKGVVQLAGDLSGTAASPSVAKVAGAAVSGTPAFGRVLAASSGSAATWQVPPGLFATTGTLSGGTMTVNGINPNAFDIVQTVAYMIDYVTTPSSPTITQVTIPAQTVTLSGAALTRQLNWWVADVSGNITAMPFRPTETQRRTSIQLGATFSPIPPTSGITVIQTLPVVLNQPANQLYDLMYSLGPFNITGNQVTANGANLSFNKSSGSSFQPSFNYVFGGANDPHTVDNPVETPSTFRYCTQLSGSIGALTTVLDVTHYDVGGTITAIPGGVTQAALHRVFLFGTGVATTQMLVQYGQTVYANLAAAVAGAGHGNYTLSPDIGENGTLIAWVAAQKNCTSLLDTTTSSIIPAGRFATL